MDQQTPRRQRKNAAPTPNEAQHATPEEDLSRVQNQYSYYYTRASAYDDSKDSFFAPPVKLNETQPTLAPQDTASEDGPQTNVYHRISTANEPGEKPAPAYTQTEVKAPPKAKKRFNPLWLLPFIPVLAFAVILFLNLKPASQPTAPTAGYTAAPSGQQSKGTNTADTNSHPEGQTSAPSADHADTKSISAFAPYSEPFLTEDTADRIRELAPKLDLSSAMVSSQNILLPQEQANGRYDFYFFSAKDGKLIAYFDDLDQKDAIILQDGRLYVRQSPFVLNPDGSAVVSPAVLRQHFGEGATLHPFYRGWAAVENASGEWSFISEEGKPFSNMEYAKLFPFGGDYTVAYLDMDSNDRDGERYLLDILCADGSSTHWKKSADTDEIVLSAMGLALTEDGAIYRLPDTASPAYRSQSITLYPEFDAMVLADENGKLGLYVQGQLYGDSRYDAINPMSSSLPWKEARYRGENCTIILRTLAPQLTALPLTYSFELVGEDGKDYVSLSLLNHDPLLLQGELPAPMEVVE